MERISDALKKGCIWKTYVKKDSATYWKLSDVRQTDGVLLSLMISKIFSKATSKNDVVFAIMLTFSKVRI